MEESVRKLFERYESLFKQSLSGAVDMDDVASLYASDFIAATPAGVMAGKNDNRLKEDARQNQADVALDFEVHYLVQKLHAEPKVFGKAAVS